MNIRIDSEQIESERDGGAHVITSLDYFRQLNMAGLVVRLLLAMICGGIIGIDRGRRGRAAGFRTYMLVCAGAALTMMIGQYQRIMFEGPWRELLSDYDIGTVDVSRYSAQVVNGIGFLGAGTIIFTGIKQVKGLTTAAGLWASACMGLAVGAGFYEAVILCLMIMVFSVRYFMKVEAFVREKSHNLNIYVTFDSLKNLGEIITCIKAQNVHIYSVDVDTESDRSGYAANAVFYLRLIPGLTHETVISRLMDLDCIQSVREL